MNPLYPKSSQYIHLGRGMNWRHDDERMGFFKCADDPLNSLHPFRYRIHGPLGTLRKKMLDNYGLGRATVSLKTHEMSMQVSI